MRSTVRFKLSSEETAEYHEFCREVGMSPERAAKHALFYCISDVRAKAMAMYEKQLNEVANGAGSGDLTSNSGETHPLPTDNSATLAGQESTATDRETGEESSLVPGAQVVSEGSN